MAITFNTTCVSLGQGKSYNEIDAITKVLRKGTPLRLPDSISEFPSLPRHSANIWDADHGLFSRSLARGKTNTISCAASVL
mgnify:FL=1